MSAKYDITSSALEAAGWRPIHAGDTYSHRFTIERPAGTPLSLVGAKLWFSIKQGSKESDTQAKLFYVSTDPTRIEIHTPAEDGSFSIHFNPVDTQNLEGVWDYDIKAKLVTSNIIRLARGKIEFLANLTKAYS